jgi:hypothetical protein
VLQSSRVIAFAIVPDDLQFTGRSQLYVADVLVGRVPRLAICENLGEDIGPMLFHCNEAWDVIGTSGATTIEETKLLAERNYPGIHKHWQSLNVSREEALAYYDAEMGKYICSFCGKRPFEYQGAVEGKGAVICRGCVEDFHHEFAKSDDSDKNVV